MLLDNYDSFTMNLAHVLAQLGADVAVVRHDATTVEAALAAKPAGVVLSPGPLTPAEAGICVPLVQACADAEVPVLGICLGEQAIGVAFGGRVVRARRPVHGRATPIHHEGAGLLAGLRNPFEAARYHSLVVEEKSLPRDLEVTARSDEGEIMALRHTSLPIEGLQFHPESYLTRTGPRMLSAFLVRCGIPSRGASRVRL